MSDQRLREYLESRRDALIDEEQLFQANELEIILLDFPGAVDAEAEVQRLREALSTIAAYDGDFLSGEDAKEMRSIARSLSPQKGETPGE